MARTLHAHTQTQRRQTHTHDATTSHEPRTARPPTPVAPAPRPEHTKLTSTCTRAPYDIHLRLYIRARLNGAHALPEVLRCELWQPVSLDLRHVSHVEAGGEEELVEDDAANAPREEHRRRVH